MKLFYRAQGGGEEGESEPLGETHYLEELALVVGGVLADHKQHGYTLPYSTTLLVTG